MSQSISQRPIAHLFRQLTALMYDSLVMMAIIVFIGFLYVAMHQKITGSLEAANHPLFLQLTLFPLEIIACFSFYATCWMRSGSTLGMQAWRIRLISQNGKKITLLQCVERSALACLSFACLGLGYWSALWHPEKLTWHDRGSKTRVVWVAKKK